MLLPANFNTKISCCRKAALVPRQLADQSGTRGPAIAAIMDEA
jgi:hypothetical protein